MTIIQFRKLAARRLPRPIGVYALCDLDAVPVYVGQSKDGIRSRVNRHITSARSDIIANRMIDVWEIAYVMCWPFEREDRLDQLEAHLFHRFNAMSPLMNGTIPPTVEIDFEVPGEVMVQVLPEAEIVSRRRVDLRLTRQAKHFGDLLDHFLGVKDSEELYLALRAHFVRLTRYFVALRADPTAGADG